MLPTVPTIRPTAVGRVARPGFGGVVGGLLVGGFEVGGWFVPGSVGLVVGFDVGGRLVGSESGLPLPCSTGCGVGRAWPG